MIVFTAADSRRSRLLRALRRAREHFKSKLEREREREHGVCAIIARGARRARQVEGRGGGGGGGGGDCVCE